MPRIVIPLVALAFAITVPGSPGLLGQEPAKEPPKVKEEGKVSPRSRLPFGGFGPPRTDDRARDLVRVLAESKNPMVRKQAARALGRLGTQARVVVADLRASLKTEADADVKEAIAAAIEQVDPPFEKLSASELQRRLANEEDLKTRQALVKAFAQRRFVNDRNVMLTLETLLLDEELAGDAAAALEALEKVRAATTKEKF